MKEGTGSQPTPILDSVCEWLSIDKNTEPLHSTPLSIFQRVYLLNRTNRAERSQLESLCSINVLLEVEWVENLQTDMEGQRGEHEEDPFLAQTSVAGIGNQKAVLEPWGSSKAVYVEGQIPTTNIKIIVNPCCPVTTGPTPVLFSYFPFCSTLKF